MCVHTYEKYSSKTKKMLKYIKINQNSQLFSNNFKEVDRILISI